nr:phosphatase PAP2 family protein [Schleiferilactobacillus shenzhenensis]
MEESTKRRWFLISAMAFIVLMALATAVDLPLSNAVIDYGSWFGTFFQTFGEFPLYFVYIISGEIAMAYAWRRQDKPLFAGSLGLGGFVLTAWQTKQYVNETGSYFAAVQNNLKIGQPIGKANSDSAAVTLSVAANITVWLILLVLVTISVQLWLSKKSDDQVARLLVIAVFATAAAWFAAEANATLKQDWGRVRPYELNKSQSDFTSWLHPNGNNGHKSFPSGHTMAATLAIVLSWFATGKARQRWFVFGIVWGALVALSRIRIGAHFFSDVTFSFFLTALIIYIFAELMTYLQTPGDDGLTQ